MLFPRISYRDEWAEAIQMVAESLAKQEEEGILCSPTSQIENVNEEEMDTSISHYKRKVETALILISSFILLLLELSWSSFSWVAVQNNPCSSYAGPWSTPTLTWNKLF